MTKIVALPPFGIVSIKNASVAIAWGKSHKTPLTCKAFTSLAAEKCLFTIMWSLTTKKQGPAIIGKSFLLFPEGFTYLYLFLQSDVRSLNWSLVAQLIAAVGSGN